MDKETKQSSEYYGEDQQNEEKQLGIIEKFNNLARRMFRNYHRIQRFIA